MVKLARGGMNNSNRGRSKPRPLFPPGELPLFGPPPAYMRRPGPPIPPPARGPIGYDYGPPPPPPMRLPPHLGPPMPPPPHMPLRGRPGRPPPPMPLLQAPVMPPRPLPFLRGRGMGPRMGPGKKLGKGIKKAKNRRNKKGAPNTSQNKPEEAAKASEEVKKEEEDILNGPWINDSIKAEIEKMNDLKKKSDETKNSSDVDLYSEQQNKVNAMASAAKMEYIGSQPDSNVDDKPEEKNGTGEQKETITVRYVIVAG